MKLHFKQRLFSWFDSYDIYNDYGETVFTVEGKMAWGHRLVIYNAGGKEIGEVKQHPIALFPTFDLIQEGEYIGEIRKEFSFFKPVYSLKYHGWRVEGNFVEWNYQVYDETGATIITVDKEIFNWTDTYTINIERNEDMLMALMIVLAIDAAICSSGND